LEIALSSPPTPPSTAASIAALDRDEGNANENNSKLAAEWNEWRKQVNYACALLANATRTEKGSVEFIGLSFPKEAIPSHMVKDDGEEKDSSDDGGAYGKRDTTKPTAALLLSRFLNPAFIDTSSPGYESAVEEWNKPAATVAGRSKRLPLGMVDEYDPDFDDDLDDEALEEEEEPTNEPLEPKKVEPTLNAKEFYDPYQHVAAVLLNIAQLDTGREFLIRLIYPQPKKSLKPLSSIQEDGDEKKKEEKDTSGTSTSHLQSLLPQLNSPNLFRRQGIAGTLKNSCFSRDAFWWLLNVVHLDKHLLMPLAGPEELTIDEKVGLDPDYWLLGPQKVREPDPLVRIYLIEALLLLLASGRRSRETLRERRTYVVIKIADMVEQNEEVSERLLECVQYLRRDEEGTEEGSADKRAYESYARGMIQDDDEKNEGVARKMLPPSTTAKGEDDEDYDNID